MPLLYTANDITREWLADLECKYCDLTQMRPHTMFITGRPNGPILFCTLSSVGVVCRRL